MNALQQLYTEYSPRDAVLLAQTPAVMMPRFGTLPPVAVGARRYVIARDGLFVQARTTGLDLTLCMQRFDYPLPYGPLKESVSLTGGLIPADLLRRFMDAAVEHAPIEKAAVVEWDVARNEYVLRYCHGEASASHISYDIGDINESQLVVDLHSHGHGAAFFSPTDDASDRHGVYFAMVLGRCRSAVGIEIETRIVVDGWHRLLPWHPFDGD